MAEGSESAEPRVDPRPEPRPWAPSRWRVRTKVVAVVLVPLVLALVLAAVTVGNQLAERSALQQVAAGTRLSGTVAGLVDALQVERSEATAFVAADRRPDRTPLDLAADRVDRAVGALRDAGPSVTELDPGVQDRYAVALARLDGLGALRSAAVATRYPAPSVVTSYTGFVEPLLDLARDVAGTAGQTAVVRPATSLAALGRAKEQAEIQHALLLVAAAGGTFPSGDGEALRSAVAEQAAATAEFEAGASPAQVQVFEDTVAGPEVDQRIRILQTALLRDGGGQPPGVDPVAWDRAAGATREAMRTVETGLFTELEGTADALVSRAGTTVLVVGIAVVLGVLLAVLLAALIAGSLITPLRRLRYSALDVAERRLPTSIQRLEEGSGDEEDTDVEPVPIDTDEEVGEVARAFDTVHREAVRLAGEQARLRTNLNALFVNLSRRSQGLVERQLLVIDSLEGREEDPDVLAELFALDHLATRLRRNGENLLVLGGSAPARGGSEPVPVTDLVRAASGRSRTTRASTSVRRRPSTSAGPGGRPHPPARRAPGQRDHLLAARRTGAWSAPPRARRRVRPRGHRPGPGHGRRRARRGERPPRASRRCSTARCRARWACSWSVSSRVGTRSWPGCSPGTTGGSRRACRCPPRCSSGPCGWSRTRWSRTRWSRRRAPNRPAIRWASRTAIP